VNLTAWSIEYKTEMDQPIETADPFDPLDE
jgi:hypothetical protein